MESQDLSTYHLPVFTYKPTLFQSPQHPSIMWQACPYRNWNKNEVTVSDGSSKGTHGTAAWVIKGSICRCSLVGSVSSREAINKLISFHSTKKYHLNVTMKQKNSSVKERCIERDWGDAVAGTVAIKSLGHWAKHKIKMALNIRLLLHHENQDTLC
jgi:hypothetical protein